MAEYTPYHSGGAIPFTSQASAAVVGGKLVAVSGNNTVAVAGAAAATVVGVAAHDAASGAKVAVWPIKNVTHEIVAAGVIAAGDNLASAASGNVAAIGAGLFATLIGRAVAGAADTALCRFIGV